MPSITAVRCNAKIGRVPEAEVRNGHNRSSGRTSQSNGRLTRTHPIEHPIGDKATANRLQYAKSPSLKSGPSQPHDDCVQM